MTTPVEKLAEDARRIIGAQVAQQEAARKVASDLAAASQQAAGGQGQAGAAEQHPAS